MTAVDDAIWYAVREAIRAHTGMTIPSTMRNIVARAVVELGLDDPNQRLQDPAIRERLLDRLFLGTSWFTREQAGIDALVRSLVPVSRTRSDRAVTVWSAGCATGQEPFALAMTLVDAGCAPRIIATDFHHPSLAVAREARYSTSTYERIPESWRRRYFEHSPEGGYRVVEPLRACVRFTRHNFAIDPPIATHLDGVVCRNALIYFERRDALAAISRLAAAVRDGGFLLLGALEAPLLWMSVNDPRFGTAALPLVELTSGSPLRVPAAPMPKRVPRRARTQPAIPTPFVADALERSRSLERTGHLDEALHALDEPTAIAPLDAAAHLARGLLLKQLGRLDEAIQELRVARFLDPVSWLAPYQLATCLERTGEPEDALEAYRHTLGVIDGGGRSGMAPSDESVETLAATTASSCRKKLGLSRARTNPGIG
jgi:chemotaxis protein methyltransferase CheR